MYTSGSQNQLNKSSSQTLKMGLESQGIGEENNHAQSNQVQNLEPISDRNEYPDEQDENHIITDQNNDQDVPKNMKNSNVDQDYRINTNNQSSEKINDPQQSNQKYDPTLQVTNQVNSVMSNDTRRQSNAHNILNGLDDQKNKIKDVKIDSKTPDKSVDDSLLMDTDMRFKIEDTDQREFKDQNMIDDEMTERIRLQGEMMIQQPDIIQNQPHKQLEKAMKEQASHREMQQEHIQKKPLIFPESNYSSIENGQKANMTRGDSIERKDNSGLYDFLDGSFGRKKRENMISQENLETLNNGRDNRFRNFKIEKPSYMIENQGTYEQIRNSNYEELKNKAMESVQYKFGMAGPSGRHTKIGSKGISTIGGIGSGLGVSGEMNIQDNFKYESYRAANLRKSIPKEIFSSGPSTIESGLTGLAKADQHDNILHGRDNQRRTVSSSPFGRDTYESRYSGHTSLIEKDNQIRNRHKSPIDEIYKKYNIIQKQESGAEDIDDQFKQCQDLLEKAKQRRLLLGGVQASALPLSFKDMKYDRINDKQIETNPLGSRNSIVSKESGQEPIDVPDVKTLHQRYEHLMQTIQEHAKEDSVTDHSHTLSNGDLLNKDKIVGQAKTMKWKKGEKTEQNQGHEYKQQRPLRVPKPSIKNTTGLSSSYDYLMSKHDNSSTHDRTLPQGQDSVTHNFTEVNHNHIASFGRVYHDRSQEVLPNMGDEYQNMRPKSLGKTNFRTQIHEYENSTSQIDKKDYSQISNGARSQISQERSFYKPHSPEMKSIEKIQHSRPFVQRVSQERKSNIDVNSIERVPVSSYLDNYGGYQMNITPINQSQPQVSKKFQIERKNYDDFGKTSQFDQKFDKFENSYQSNILMNSQQTQQTVQSHMTSTVSQPIVGQIGKIVRQSGPKINTLHQTSVEDNKLTSGTPPKSQRSHFNTQDYRQNQLQSKEITTQFFQDQIKNVDQQINPVTDIGNSYLNSVKDMYKKQGIVSQVNETNSSKGLTINTNLAVKDPQFIPTPTEAKSNVVSQATVDSAKSLFPKLEQIQQTLQQATKDQPQMFKKVSYSKYQSSFMMNQFNSEFVYEIVNQMQDITNMVSSVQQQNVPLNLNFDSIETQQSIQKLNTQYDTSKDPKTWVIQLYEDMCNARSLATQHETDIQKLRDQNFDLQKQNSDMIFKLETLKLGGSIQTPVMSPPMQSLENTMGNEMKNMYEEKIKTMTQTELEWMERIDALITCQKFYKQKEPVSPTCFDPETSDPKQVFGKLLNKLEVLLCQSELDKSKNKKLMATTVKEMDKRITQITNKFQKIQKQIIETCSFADDDKSSKTPRSSIMGENEDTKSDIKEGPSVRSTIEMLKRIRRDRDEQEKIIEQLKQIIQIQDKMKKSEFDKMNVDIKNNLIKNIEHFVNEEHKKEPRKMKLAWVTEMSDISASCNDLNLMDNSIIVKHSAENLSQAPLIVPNMFKSQEDQTVNQTELEIVQGKINDFEIKSFITSGVQTDIVQGEKKVQQVTKIFKEINLQTDDVIIQEIHEQEADAKLKNVNIQADEATTVDKDQVDDEIEKKSSSTTERRQKQLNTLSADLKQNMNEMLNEQLSKHLQQNMSEIASIKQENGRLIEKYKFEQKQVHKLKDDIKKKQKYEIFFEKQRAKKFRNCGCQVGQTQMKLAYTDQNSSSYYDKNPDMNKSVSVKSSAPPQKYRNKENHSKTRQDKNMDPSKITLKNKNPSKSPSFDKKSQDQYNSIEDHQSLNTQALAYKYGVTSDNGKVISHFKNESSITVNKNEESNIQKTLSNIQSPSIHINESFAESKQLNGQERQLLDYHMKKNEELHNLLMTYLSKGQGAPQNANVLSPYRHVSQLTTLSPAPAGNGIGEQRTAQTHLQSNLETLQSKENHDPEASNLASSANFGQRVDHKNTEGEDGQQMNIHNYALNDPSDKTDGTKKCNYIDQYFSYKNHQKKEINQTPSSNNQPSQQNMDIHQSFGNINAMHAAITNNMSLLSPNQQNNDSGISAGFKAFIEKEVIKKPDVIEMDSKKMQNPNSQSVSANRAKRDQDDENDNNSDIVNVSEQIKQIEGRQMIHCDLLEGNQKV